MPLIRCQYNRPLHIPYVSKRKDKKEKSYLRLRHITIYEVHLDYCTLPCQSIISTQWKYRARTRTAFLEQNKTGKFWNKFLISYSMIAVLPYEYGNATNIFCRRMACSQIHLEGVFYYILVIRKGRHFKRVFLEERFCILSRMNDKLVLVHERA